MAFNFAILCFSDILFGRIYEQFSHDPLAQGTFLECLEPYMLSDRLSSITPDVMQDFVEHFTAHGMLASLEQCIIHMDIASLDIHQVCNDLIIFIRIKLCFAPMYIFMCKVFYNTRVNLADSRFLHLIQESSQTQDLPCFVILPNVLTETRHH